jgi:hypothetical protein
MTICVPSAVCLTGGNMHGMALGSSVLNGVIGAKGCFRV